MKRILLLACLITASGCSSKPPEADTAERVIPVPDPAKPAPDAGKDAPK